MKINKRYLQRIIREERRKLFEDSMDDELGNLKKNVHDDIEHIKDIKKDIEDDRDEEERARDHRKDESRRRRSSRRVGYSTLRRMIREQQMGDVEFEQDPAASAHVAIAAIADLAAAAGVELDITAGDVEEDDLSDAGLVSALPENALKRRLRRKIREAARSWQSAKITKTGAKYQPGELMVRPYIEDSVRMFAVFKVKDLPRSVREAPQGATASVVHEDDGIKFVMFPEATSRGAERDLLFLTTGRRR